MNVHILKRWGGANQRFAYAFAVENAILTSHESLLPLSKLHPPFDIEVKLRLTFSPKTGNKIRKALNSKVRKRVNSKRSNFGCSQKYTC